MNKHFLPKISSQTVPILPILFGTLLLQVFASPLPKPCKRTVRTQQALKHITQTFIIVEKTFAGAKSSINQVLQMKPRKQRRDVTSASSIQGSSACPWIWRNTRIRPNEFPSVFSRAVCPGCGHFCEPVRYAVMALVKDGCDPKSGMSIWRWKQRRIPIAYVYKS